jgi:alpha-tubulin suppressor-like RCC1 family protein
VNEQGVRLITSIAKKFRQGTDQTSCLELGRVQTSLMGFIALLLLLGCDDVLGPPAGSGLWVRQANVVLEVGEEAQLRAAYSADRRASIDTLPTVSWRSNAPAVLSVTEDGRASAGSVGAAHVFVSKKGFRDSLTVHVVSKRSYTARWAGVSVGDETTCAWTASGRLYCWGGDTFGAIGDGVRRQWTHAHAPVPVAGQTRFLTAAVGLFFACGITESLQTLCWGDALPLQEPGGGHVLSPRAVSGASGVESLSLGADHACGLDGDGVALCWGASIHGELGDGTPGTNRPYGEPVVGAARFTRLVAGHSHTCGLATDGRVLCWGSPYGSGDPQGLPRVDPTELPGGGSYDALEGEGNACARFADSGDWVCWGWNNMLQLEGSQTTAIPPTSLGPEKQLEYVMPGPVTTCGHAGDGALVCWGYDEHGNLGDNTASDSCCNSQPQSVAGGLIFRSISSSMTVTCGVTTADALYCWGSNKNGQLGDGSLVPRSDVPVRVEDPFW